MCAILRARSDYVAVLCGAAKPDTHVVHHFTNRNGAVTTSLSEVRSARHEALRCGAQSMAGGHRTIAGKLREKHGVSEVLSKQRLALDSDSSLHTDSLVCACVCILISIH